jgi:2-methylcitrate dehydratase PrpD
MLREEGLLNAREITSITCPVAPWVMPMICEPRAEKVAPKTEAQAKLSLYYGVAAAFLLNRVDLNAFSPETLADPHIAELAQKIVCTPDPDAPEDQTKGWLIARTVDGRKLETVLTHPLGSPNNPMSADDVARKFRDNMAFANLKANAARVEELVARIEMQATIDELVDSCCRA